MSCVEEDVVLDRGDCRLEGTLSRPDATGPRGTIVLIVAGSGPTDRDGNGLPLGLRTDALKQIAEALAEGGVATLRYDKRGVGRSANGVTDEHALRFEAYVADAAAWVRELAADPRFDRVAVLGHSEGALIAAQCAPIAPVAAVISVAGAARPAGELLRRQLAGRLPPSLATVHESILAGLEAGRTTDDVPAELRMLYRASVQPYLISWLRQRPLDAVAALDVPLLVVHGSADAQVEVGEASLLAAARPDAQVVLVDGMDHVLKAPGVDGARRAASYTDPTRPLAPGLVDAILRFLDSSC